MGSAEGPSPFAGSLRVSLRYNFPLFLTRKSAKGIVERVFQHPAGGRGRCDVMIALTVVLALGTLILPLVGLVAQW